MCFVGCGASPSTPRNISADIVTSYVAAYNAHDIDKMLSMTTDDIHWMDVQKNEISSVSRGKNALASGLRQYFENLPSAQSRIRDIQANGTFVSVVEEAMWNAGGTDRKQCALAIYELVDRLIANVWYIGGQPCDALH